MEIENAQNSSDSRLREEQKIVFKPVKVEEIPPPSKEDLEIMLVWNMRLFPFLLENYDKIFKGEGHSNPVNTEIIHSISSGYCPNV